MATFTWSAGTSADWNVVGDWSPQVGAPPGLVTANTDVASFNRTTTGSKTVYKVTVAKGETFDLSAIDLSTSNGVHSLPSLSISGSLLTSTLAYDGKTNADITINAGGLFDIRTSITDALSTAETITIAGTGTGGHLEFGSAKSNGIGVNNANVAYTFSNNASGMNAGIIEYLSGFVSGSTTTNQHIGDVAWGDGIIFDGANFTGDTVTLVGTTLTVKNGGTTVLTMNNITAAAGTTFSASGNEIFAVCYVRGTLIATPGGPRPIETLRAGEQVLTVVDGAAVSRAVKWLGHRRIDLLAHTQPETVAPIRILRDAFADGVPQRDLLLSPDHAVFVDGKLVCARQLVNGATIQRETGWTVVDYYHVELDSHAILLAEGLPAESYLDTGNSGFFANSGSPLVLHPDLTDESDYPTREAASCAPFVSAEAIVRPIWQQLAERATAMGRPLPEREITTDAGLCLVAKGRTVKPMYCDNDLVIFALPRGATEVRLVSRAQPPNEARPWLDDGRRLGVRVARIVLRTADDVREIPVDHPSLEHGWWGVERDGAAPRRWTNGDAALPLPMIKAGALLEVHLGGTMTYAVEADRRAA